MEALSWGLLRFMGRRMGMVKLEMDEVRQRQRQKLLRDLRPKGFLKNPMCNLAG
jgi:hypothetical protein